MNLALKKAFKEANPNQFEMNAEFTQSVNAVAGTEQNPLVVSDLQFVYRNLRGDSDKDGLPDSWEEQKFGNLAQNSWDDPDDDKRTNFMEQKQGTDPKLKDAAPAYVPPPAQINGNPAYFDWVSNKLYQSGDWKPLRTGTGGRKIAVFTGKVDGDFKPEQRTFQGVGPRIDAAEFGWHLNVPDDKEHPGRIEMWDDRGFYFAPTQQ
jgi:hypothetical protein